MKNYLAISFVCISFILVISQCTQQPANNQTNQTQQVDTLKPSFSGFESQEKWGEHLVTIGSCNDCHTPKKMTPQGPEIDSTLLLSGHPAKMPPPDINRKEVETKGLVVTTNNLTSWVGQWGTSFAANLTSDSTGIGGWQQSNFITAIRQGKYKGLPSSRSLLPPMPWQMYRHMTDDELNAIFAYLKSTKPINNVVPAPQPPIVTATQ